MTRMLAISLSFLPWLLSAAQAQQLASAQRTDEALPPITFSNLVFRSGDDDGIAKARAELRVLMVETMRHEGYNAVGAESLVFDRDDSSNAEYLFGGTVREAACRRPQRNSALCCRIAIDWELLDVATEKVSYRVLTRYGECELDGVDEDVISRRLAVNALRRALRRPKLKETLRASAGVRKETHYDPLEYQRCGAAPITMAKSPDPALDATVLVNSGMGHGSGFFISSSGLLMTAAHVVTANKLTVALRDGSAFDALPLRISREFDVALLRVVLPPERTTHCLPLGTDGSGTGSEVYAIGAPASKQLAFSLTRGIVSGSREFRGERLVQTDAPVSPGNSGGPLVDRRGRLVAIVSRKLVGGAIEGVSFGVPASVAMTALGLVPAAATDAKLAAAAPIAVTTGGDSALVDTPDELQVFPTVTASIGSNNVRTVFWERGVHPIAGYRYLRGRFYLGSGYGLWATVAPRFAGDQFVLALNNGQGYSRRRDCNDFKFSINGREYAPGSRTTPPPKGVMAEGLYGVSILQRLEEPAPSVQIDACGQNWQLTPTQIEGFRKLLPAYEALKAE